MPQKAWSDKRERQYEHIKNGLLKGGMKLTPFHGHRIVLTEGVRDAQSKTALPGAIS
jgi:hypothetical protein